MSDRNRRDSYAGFIRSVTHQIWERAHNGQLNYERDIATLKNLLEGANRAGRTYEQSRILNVMGVLESMRGNHHLTTRYFQEGINCLQADLNEPASGQLTLIGNLADLSARLYDFDSALSLYEDMCRLSVENNQVDDYARALCGKAEVLLHTHQPAPATECLQEALNLTTSPDSSIHAKAFRLMSVAHMQMHQTRLAMITARQALGLVETSHNFVEYGLANLTMARALAVASKEGLTEDDPIKCFAECIRAFNQSEARYEYALALRYEAEYWILQGEHYLAQENIAHATSIFLSMNLQAAARDVASLMQTAV